MTRDPPTAFRATVLATIDAHSLLPRLTRPDQQREPVIVATSGGPDSVALLVALCELAGVPGATAYLAPGEHAGGGMREERTSREDRKSPSGPPCIHGGLNRAGSHPPLGQHGLQASRGTRPAAPLAIAPIVAHLNHGLRGDAADEDQRFVEELARARGLPCEVGRADVRAEAAALGVGIEEAGRLARRRFLADVARRRGATKIALAHHADDRAETILFHILRGTGIDGLAALGPRAELGPQGQIVEPPLSPCGTGAGVRGEIGEAPLGPWAALAAESGDSIEIIRPMIDVTRADVLAYLAATGQAYRTDDSNASDAYTRNRVRNELLPLLAREFNPKIAESLVRLGDQAAAAATVLDDALDAVWRQIVREVPGAIVIDADDFAPLRPWLQGAIIRRAVQRLGGGLKFMSADWTREIVAQLLAKTVAGPINLPGGIVAMRNRRTIRLAQRSAECGVRNAE